MLTVILHGNTRDIVYNVKNILIRELNLHDCFRYSNALNSKLSIIINVQKTV